MITKIKHDTCLDCHSDYHKGDFQVNGETTDCKICHDENGYRPSHFTLEQHNNTKFELTGSHLAVSCQNCHLLKDQWHFRNIGKNCIDCHKNVHGNEIKAQFMPNNDCSFCHNTDNWFLIKYNHDLTSFKLSGKHLQVPCGKCHHNTTNANNDYKFASVKPECQNCHKDIHFDQFKYTSCNSCHGFNNWKPEAFDHNKTGFQLVGAHQNLKCESCHKKIETNGNIFTKYKLENFRCASCHS